MQPETAPLAGGTHLLAGREAPAAVVDLQALGLDEIKQQGGRLHLGATARLAKISEAMVADADSETPARLLQQTIHLAGPNTYRNAATPGGIVAARLPDSEFLAALLVLNADVALRTPEITSMRLADYLGRAERPRGLITAITIPWAAGQGASERVARTPADYPIVSVTLWQPKDKPPRLAATGISQRPMRLDAAEQALAAGITDKAIEAAAAAARAACQHPGDFRGDAAYRAEMATVLTRRVLQGLS